MSEQHQRQRVIRALKSLDAVSIENSVMPGTPDVNYIDGWLELKYLKSWPKKEDSPVIISHFTPQQRSWLKRRWLRGGNVFLLLQVGNEWLLFDGIVAAEQIGTATRSVLHSLARRIWLEGLKDTELRELLSGLTRRASIYG